jgi:hypothetical protein
MKTAKPMSWKEDASSIEIRTQGELPDGRPALDEIVASGASVTASRWTTTPGGWASRPAASIFHLNFTLRDGQLHVHLSDQAEDGAEWEGDSRPRPLPGEDDPA